MQYALYKGGYKSIIQVFVIIWYIIFFSVDHFGNVDTTKMKPTLLVLKHNQQKVSSLRLESHILK